MHRWYVANGGPLAIVLVGLSIAGLSSRVAGLVIIAVGAAIWIGEGFAWAVARARQGGAAEEPSSPARAPVAMPAMPEHRPDLRVVELKWTGGSSDHLTFSAYVANYGTQQCRASFSASVNGEAVECVPHAHDLIPNTEPKRVSINVPRPRLGNLVHAFANEPTLYGRTLRFEAVADSERAAEEWTEELYDRESNRERHEIQQREWRIGRGEATPADDRADRIAELMRRHDEE